MRYILNSAVITTPGRYSYRLVSIQEAKKWLRQGEYESTIGYAETAFAFQRLFNFSIAINRKLIHMKAGDEALIFRLKRRIGNPDSKGKLTPDFILQNCEIGLLKKEEEK